MSSRFKILGYGSIILVIVLIFWFVEYKPKQEFDQEMDYYLTMANLRPEVVSVEFKDDVLNEYDTTVRTLYIKNRLAFRAIFQENIDNPAGYKVLIRIDSKNRVIVIHHFGIEGWYSP